MKRVVAALAAMSGLCSPAASATVADARHSKKAWVVDYGETACSAMRQYGDEQNQLLLILRPSPYANVLQLLVLRTGRAVEAVHVPTVVSFLNTPLKTTGLRYSPARSKYEIVLISLNRSEVERIGNAPDIEINVRGVLDERFAIPGVGKVMAALDQCNANLQAYWNISATAGNVQTPPRPLKPLGSYLSWEDYPTQAIREGAGGTARVTLMIDEKGYPKDCLVEQTSGIATLDAMSCYTLKARAKFEPAKDADGKPVRSTYSQGITWRISG